MKVKQKVKFGFDGKPIKKVEKPPSRFRQLFGGGLPRDYINANGCYIYRKIEGCP